MELFVRLAEAVGFGFKAYSWLIIAAFILSWIDADPSNPMVRFVYRATMPLWHWIQDRVPRTIAPLAPLLALEAADYGEIFFPGIIRSVGGLVVGQLALNDAILNSGIYALLGLTVVGRSMIFFLMILCLFYFVFTLVKPGQNNHLVRSVVWMIDPFLTPLQRLLPRAKVDLSPIVLGIGLYLAFHFTISLGFDLQGQLFL